jgi:hypothetical protein
MGPEDQQCAPTTFENEDTMADLTRGVLLAGRFRTFEELNPMSHDEQRNTLITVLVGLTNQPVSHFQAMSDAALAGAGAGLVFLRAIKSRTDAQLKTISDDDQRNLMIVTIGAQTHLPGATLQALSTMDLVGLGLGRDESFIRGVLLAGEFRTFEELTRMSHDDQRNTLITVLRSEERRVGKECNVPCRSRWSPDH